MSSDQTTPRSATGLRAWRWPAVVIIIALLTLLGFRAACRTVRDGGLAAVSALGNAVSIGEAFRTDRITTTFISSLPRLSSDDGTKLELVAIESVETITRTDDRRFFYDMLPLGATVSEIRVPVTYRYHLRLDDPWRLEVRDQACIVHAPAIRATLPPAIDTAGLERRSSSGWLRFDADEQMVELERNLTALLGRRAADPDAVDLVRETCRRRTAEFVRNWLLAEDQWRSDRFRSVTVIFADDSTADPSAMQPTLSIRSNG